MGVNRRSFIKYASLAAAGNAAGLRPFGALNSLAQSTTDYKALVCVFLYGGNDANNMLVQFDTAGYGSYSTIRGPLAVPQNSLIQLGQAPNFSLNSNMPEIATLFDSKAAALVTNVGTLVAPTTKAQYQAGSTVPTNLFSHPDQQLEWQNAAQSGSTQTGWAGRIADQLSTTYNPGGQVPMITLRGWRHPLLQRRSQHSCLGEPGKSRWRKLRRRHYGVCSSAGHGTGSPIV